MKFCSYVFLSAVLFYGCSSESTIEILEQSFPEGNPKVVGLYKVQSDTFRVGEKHFYPESSLRMIAFYDSTGARMGEWKYYFEDGKLWSACEYKSGLKHGKSEVYYPNGQLRYEGEYQNDQPVEGSFTYYDEQGEVSSNE